MRSKKSPPKRANLRDLETGTLERRSGVHRTSRTPYFRRSRRFPRPSIWSGYGFPAWNL